MAQIPGNYTVIDLNDDDTLFVNTPDEDDTLYEVSLHWTTDTNTGIESFIAGHPHDCLSDAFDSLEALLAKDGGKCREITEEELPSPLVDEFYGGLRIFESRNKFGVNYFAVTDSIPSV